MRIKLVEIGGEFCTSRKAPSIAGLRQQLDSCLENDKSVVIETAGVKILTPSYIDELIPPLMVKHGEAKVLNLIEFTPPLTGFLKEQLTRGLANRIRAIPND